MSKGEKDTHNTQNEWNFNREGMMNSCKNNKTMYPIEN